ncbi:metal-dependent phosphohydrolase [Undibacterium sp. Ji50W]|uniref:metal-dependent phosphohydrolase n=1 Tax=Undibacterium sp. Ji50W TaxID=3413041 RepID=UPI003BF22372
MTPTILTSGGTYFNFTAPGESIISIDTIAHALSHICRFTGHSSQFYSVAQHCYHVSFVVPPHLALDGLLHDAAEAYIGDVSKPLKCLLPDYAVIETQVEDAINKHFGLTRQNDPWIKRADLIMLATEQRDLMPTHDDNWFAGTDIQPLQEQIVPWDARTARMKFLSRFYNLTRAQVTA